MGLVRYGHLASSTAQQLKCCQGKEMPYHEPMAKRADERRRIAFFGGSFDPPHLGHIGVARAAQEALRLNMVLFAPVGVQPLKPLGSTASFG